MNTFAVICTFIGAFIGIAAIASVHLFLFMVDGIKADRRIESGQTAERLARLDDALDSIDADSVSILQQLRTINN